VNKVLLREGMVAVLEAVAGVRTKKQLEFAQKFRLTVIYRLRRWHGK